MKGVPMRLFAAILFDEPFKKAVLTAQSELRTGARQGNFTHPSNLHLTLAFIGEMRDASASLRAVRSVRFEPFPMTLKGSGRFGNLHWLGIESDKKADDVANRLRDALRREGVPFDPKPFKAHITIAREVEFFGEPKKIHVPETTMTVSRIALMKSERIGGKLVYTEIK